MKDDIYKWKVYTVLSSIISLYILIFSLVHLYISGLNEFLKIFPFFVAMVLIRLSANRFLSKNFIYHSFVILTIMHLFRLILIGGEGGSNLFWIVMFPMAIFMLLGIRKGIIYTIIIISLLFLAFIPSPLFPVKYEYPVSTVSRFFLSFLAITIFSINYEKTRIKLLRESEESYNKLAESQSKTESLLEEKRLLLKEVQHRIKNNISIIMNLLNLKAANCLNCEANKILLEASSLMGSMMILYKKLYERNEIHDDYLNLREFTISIADEIIRVFGLTVETEYILDDMAVSADLALKIGIIVNELMTNSCKYAFTRDRYNYLKIEIKSLERDIEIQICDNGSDKHSVSGPPPGFGLHLVQTVVTQLDGKFENRPDHGMHNIIRIPAILPQSG